MQHPYTLEFGVDPKFLPPDPLWLAVEPLLPDPKPRPKGGRPPMPNRTAFFAIFYLLRTGCQWKAIPRSLGAGSTVHDRFQAWQKAGVFEALWTTGLLEYNTDIGLDFEWQSLKGNPPTAASQKRRSAGRQLAPIPRIGAKKAQNGIFSPKRLASQSGWS